MDRTIFKISLSPTSFVISAPKDPQSTTQFSSTIAIHKTQDLTNSNGKTTWAPCSHRFLVGPKTKWTKNADIWRKKPILGQSRILIYTGESKSFGNHIMEKPPRQLVCIVFWSGSRSNGPKMPIFGPKCQFWAKFGRFWAQNPIFWGQGVKILVPSYRDSNETPFLCWKHWSVRLQLAARGKNVLFWPQNLDI